MRVSVAEKKKIKVTSYVLWFMTILKLKEKAIYEYCMHINIYIYIAFWDVFPLYSSTAICM